MLTIEDVNSNRLYIVLNLKSKPNFQKCILTELICLPFLGDENIFDECINLRNHSNQFTLHRMTESATIHLS